MHGVDVISHVGNALGWSVPEIYHDVSICRGSSILSYKDRCYFIMGRLIVSSTIITTLEMHSDFVQLSLFCSSAEIFLLLNSMYIPVGTRIGNVLHYNPVIASGLYALFWGAFMREVTA